VRRLSLVIGASGVVLTVGASLGVLVLYGDTLDVLCTLIVAGMVAGIGGLWVWVGFKSGIL
jgi:hypothetical protein